MRAPSSSPTSVAHRAGALVVLAVRADFYGRCLAYPALLAALQAPVVLGPMTVAQLREVITCPAEAECVDLEPGLAELLLRDLGVAEDAGTGAVIAAGLRSGPAAHL